jgi:murein DD-endopeptidase MepM/ murein hydrolase activator NlpD
MPRQYKGLVVDWPLDTNKIRGGVENNTFGMVRRRADGTQKPHQGWDLTTKDGEQVYSIADGVVSSVHDGGDYGEKLTIKHTLPQGGFIYTFYAHLQSISVKVGDSIAIGQPICKAGSSGNASSLPSADKHLHFEFRTQQDCGLGLAGRFSPFEAFGACPLKEAIERGA